MATVNLGYRAGNLLYKTAFPLYRKLYGIFKRYGDRAERKLLQQYLLPGSVVVDAGANIGIYTEFISKCVGPGGLVHSFEPSPENYARLTTALSKYSNLRLNQLAVSDKTGESVLYVSDDLNVDHRAYPTKGEARKTVSIQMTTLDDYFKPGQQIDLIKLDIQGYELHALRGARRVLDDNPNIKLLLEFWPYGLAQAGASAQALISFLNENGFTIFLLNGDDLIACDAPAADSSDATNYFNLFAARHDRGHSKS